MITSEEIRIEYCKRRRKISPYFNLAYPVSENDFEKAAAICNSLKASAFDFVESQCERIPPDKFYPPLLHSKNAVQNYQDYMEVKNHIEDGTFDYWLHYLKAGVKYGKQSIEQVLLDDCVPFPAWFRVLAPISPIPSVVAKYKAIARNEMTQQLREFLIKCKLDLKRIDE